MSSSPGNTQSTRSTVVTWHGTTADGPANRCRSQAATVTFSIRQDSSPAYAGYCVSQSTVDIGVREKLPFRVATQLDGTAPSAAVILGCSSDMTPVSRPVAVGCA